MKRTPNRIPVTHVGSLPRPHDLLDMMKLRLTGQPLDEAKYQARVTGAVAEIVKQQVDAGIDIVGDGEISKAGFFTYAKERLGGLQPKEGVKFELYKAEHDAFPEYYDEYFKKAMMGGTVVPPKPLFAVGPITYTGQAELKRDLANLRKAVDAVKCAGAFVPSTAPSGGRNHTVGYPEDSSPVPAPNGPRAKVARSASSSNVAVMSTTAAGAVATDWPGGITVEAGPRFSNRTS